MRSKEHLLEVMLRDGGGVRFHRNPLPAIERLRERRSILDFMQRYPRARSVEDFANDLLRRGSQCMPLPGAPHERLTVTDYGSSGSSGAGPGATAVSSAAAAASHPGNSMPWVFPSSDFIGFQKYGTVAFNTVGGIGAPTPIITFKVPNGRFGKISALGIDFVVNGGAAYTQGVLVGGVAGLTFNLTADGTPFQDFGNFIYMPGTASNPLAMPGLMLREGQKIVLSVMNTGGIAATTQFVEATIQGYYYSKNLQPKGMSYQ